MLFESLDKLTHRILSVQSDSRRQPGGDAGVERFRANALGLGLEIADLSGRLLVPIGAMLDLIGDMPLELDDLRDHLGVALRVYARRRQQQIEAALLQRGPDGRWQHLGWQPVAGDIHIEWRALAVRSATGTVYELDQAILSAG